MAEIRLQKTVLVSAAADRVLSCLQDPLFWAVLPTTFRTMDLVNRPLAIGGTLKPGLDAYRLADVSRESVSFASEALHLRYSAEPVDESSAKLTLDIVVVNTECATKPLLESVDKELLAIVELFQQTPWFAWLPEMQLRIESAPKGVEMRVSIAMDLPCELAAIEDALVRHPLEFRNWVDVDIEKRSGTIDVDQSWPAVGAQVRYKYSRQFWFLPPFGRFNTGKICLAERTPGKRVVLTDQTEPGGVRTSWDIGFTETPEGTHLHVEKKACVSAWSARILWGTFLRQVIPVETVRSVCEFAGVLARLHPLTRHPEHSGSRC